MRNISDKSCEENQNTYFMFSNSSSENRAVCEIMLKKKFRGRQITDDNIIQHMRLARQLAKRRIQAHTPNM
jgi:ribonucleotide monophosphatase NagD (HAD superfamily)